LTRLKVSGITTAADAALAVEAGADIIACVLNPASPRYVTLEQAWSVRRAIPPEVLFVGIFVDAPEPVVQRIVSHCGMDRAQLFGRESRASVESQGRAFKAVTVATSSEVAEAVRTYANKRSGAPPDLLLHLVQAAETDWQAAADAAGQSSVMLASARLSDPDVVHEAVRVAHPWAIDVWEAVEAAPGQLDRDRLARVAESVRSTR
jgi:phosphoribosylanthranilate isomerase